jgi:hypothetical protein
MTWAIASTHTVFVALALAFAILSLAIDIIFRPHLTAGEGGIDG